MNLRKQARGRGCQVERWRPVVGWEGLYEVSNLGEVRSVARWVDCRKGRRLTEGRILAKRKSVGMYWRVTLSNGDTERVFNLHRLVALAFIAGTGAHVRHLDGDGFNNRADNLAWGSAKENEADKERHGKRLFGITHPNAKLTPDDVRLIRTLKARGFSQLEIARQTGFNRGVIGTVVRREAWTHVE